MPQAAYHEKLSGFVRGEISFRVRIFRLSLAQCGIISIPDENGVAWSGNEDEFLFRGVFAQKNWDFVSLPLRGKANGHSAPTVGDKPPPYGESESYAQTAP